ncbi:MAG: hypothetical protein SPE19_06360 [Candidatus Faecousia sp.]|nr:hypothetical protein [Candidatus Faecousia sp.]
MARERRNSPAFSLPKFLQKPEFRKDSLGTGFLKKLYFTRQQRLTLLRWGSYALLCLAALVLQDTIMSRISIFGAGTDLPVAAMLLITVLEGTETGSIYILIASTIYYFSGSAPGPYTVALLTVLGICASLFRQVYWHRSRSSILLCAGIAVMVYEIAVFGFSIFSGLTYWGRFPRFAVTGILSWAAMFLMYPLTLRFGQIGGHTWKE